MKKSLKKYLLIPLISSLGLFLVACEDEKLYKLECVEVLDKSPSGALQPYMSFRVNDSSLQLYVRASHTKAIPKGQIVNVEYTHNYDVKNIEVALECKE